MFAPYCIKYFEICVRNSILLSTEKRTNNNSLMEDILDVWYALLKEPINLINIFFSFIVMVLFVKIAVWSWKRHLYESAFCWDLLKIQLNIIHNIIPFSELYYTVHRLSIYVIYIIMSILKSDITWLDKI